MCVCVLLVVVGMSVTDRCVWRKLHDVDHHQRIASQRFDVVVCMSACVSVSECAGLSMFKCVVRLLWE